MRGDNLQKKYAINLVGLKKLAIFVKEYKRNEGQYKNQIRFEDDARDR